MARTFFSQPVGKKNETNYKTSKIIRVHECEVITDTNRRPDLNEAFNWGYEKRLLAADNSDLQGVKPEKRTIMNGSPTTT